MKKLCAWQAPLEVVVKFTPEELMEKEGLNQWARPEYDLLFNGMKQNKYPFGTKVITPEGKTFIVCDIRRDSECEYIYKGDRDSGPHYAESELAIYCEDIDKKDSSSKTQPKEIIPSFGLGDIVFAKRDDIKIPGKIVSIKHGTQGFSYRVKFEDFGQEFLENDISLYVANGYKILDRVRVNMEGKPFNGTVSKKIVLGNLVHYHVQEDVSFKIWYVAESMMTPLSTIGSL